uniref:Uncharacterized protein n=1 Tax=Anguilla anguilla TaxID=7936 RepID=A0A0E9PMK3_ANGAN
MMLTGSQSLIETVLLSQTFTEFLFFHIQCNRVLCHWKADVMGNKLVPLMVWYSGMSWKTIHQQ